MKFAESKVKMNVTLIQCQRIGKLSEIRMQTDEKAVYYVVVYWSTKDRFGDILVGKWQNDLITGSKSWRSVSDLIRVNVSYGVVSNR